MDVSSALRVMQLDAVPEAGELQKRYRALAMRMHPDRNGGDDAAFKRLNQAMETLREAVLWSDSTVDVVRMSLVALMRGGVTHVGVGGECAACEGTGWQTLDEPCACPDCDASGQRRVKFGMMTSWKTCATCEGTGTTTRMRCLSCEGTGHSGGSGWKGVIPPWSEDGEEVEVKTDAGIRRIRVVVEMPKGIRRRGDDLLMEASIPYALLCLGGMASMEGAGGETWNVDIPAHTQSGSVLSCTGRGMPKRNGERGAALVRVNAAVPLVMSHLERDLIRRLGAEQARRQK